MNKTILICLLSIILFSCSQNEGENTWSVPVSEIFDGGPGKDGIPSVDAPNFVSISDINYLDEESLVVGVIHNGVAKAYPHAILDWHEIVNDEIDAFKFALTYCPLTGTAINWNRVVNGNETTFGVSGKLYNSNLIPYDRESDSNWSQIGLDCINGPLIGQRIEISSIIETSWKTWKKAFPNAQVMSTETGFSRNYGQYPYGDYITNHNLLIFPVNKSDDRLKTKERCLAILGSNSNLVVSIESFGTPKVKSINWQNHDLLVIGSEQDNLLLVFEQGLLEDFTLDLTNLPNIGVDANGNVLDITGRVVEGPLLGEQLRVPESFIGYWFSLVAFLDNIEIEE